MCLRRRFLAGAAVLMLPALGWSEPPPNVTLELVEIDPAQASVVPLGHTVYGRIRYETDAPVRFVLQAYRDRKPVDEGFYDGGSSEYAPGSGETVAWFGFRSPQTIDEVRAVANDWYGTVYAEASVRKSLTWRAGAAAVPRADWVAPLEATPKDVVEQPAAGGLLGGLLGGVLGDIVILFVELLFLLVPSSVALQVYALWKLEGAAKQLARVSGFAMAALWLFVIVTALAGSNLSPIWLVFLSPVFVLFLVLLISKGRRRPRRVVSIPR